MDEKYSPRMTLALGIMLIILGTVTITDRAWHVWMAFIPDYVAQILIDVNNMIQKVSGKRYDGSIPVLGGWIFLLGGIYLCIFSIRSGQHNGWKPKEKNTDEDIVRAKTAYGRDFYRPYFPNDDYANRKMREAQRK